MAFWLSLANKLGYAASVSQVAGTDLVVPGFTIQRGPFYHGRTINNAYSLFPFIGLYGGFPSAPVAAKWIFVPTGNIRVTNQSFKDANGQIWHGAFPLGKQHLTVTGGKPGIGYDAIGPIRGITRISRKPGTVISSNQVGIGTTTYVDSDGNDGWVQGVTSASDGTYVFQLQMQAFDPSGADAIFNGSYTDWLTVAITVQGETAKYTEENTAFGTYFAKLFTAWEVHRAQDLIDAQRAYERYQLAQANLRLMPWAQARDIAVKQGARIRRANWNDRWLTYRRSLWHITPYNPTTKADSARHVVQGSEWSVDDFQALDWTTDPMTELEASSGPQLYTFPAPSIGPGETAKIEFSAVVDGTEYLHIKGSEIWLEHEFFEAPAAIKVNGVDWEATWGEFQTSGVELDEENMPVTIPLARYEETNPRGVLEFDVGSGTPTLTVLQARESITITQYPLEANGYETIVYIDDAGPDGSDLYRLTLTWS